MENEQVVATRQIASESVNALWEKILRFLSHHLTALLFICAFTACSSLEHKKLNESYPIESSERSNNTPKPLLRTTEKPLSESKSKEMILPDTKVNTDSASFANPPSMDSIYFEFGRIEIDSRSMITLRQHAKTLKEHPQQKVSLVAFTDNIGSRSYNLAIAEGRLSSISQTLRVFGVTRNQIRHKSIGSTKQSARCITQECRSQMRRVELIYE